jgi:hypothetical protein
MEWIIATNIKYNNNSVCYKPFKCYHITVT